MRCFLFLLSFLFSVAINAQLVYPIVGHYKNKSAQGMAIYEDYAYLFNDGGLCRVLNLKSGKIEGEFMLECSSKDTHVNSACFSRQYVSDSSIPALYITEFYGKRRCFVEVINSGKSKLVQTIELKNQEGQPPFVREWIVDNKRQMLYAVIREKNQQDENVIKKFSLPKVIEGSTIVLTEENVMDEFSVNFLNGLQGGKIVGHYMYLVTGFSSLQGEGKYYNREIKVIDLKNKRLVRSIDLNNVTMNEPEDIDFYQGKLLLFAAGTGGIYSVLW